MKLLPLLFLIPFAYIQKTDKPVTVLEATHQRWSDEMPGQPKRAGDIYQVKVFINTSQKVEFTNLWIGHKHVPFRIKFINNTIQKRVENGDSLYIEYYYIVGEAEVNFPAHRLPTDYRGVALIEYTLAGKAQYVVVRSFKQLPDEHSW